MTAAHTSPTDTKRLGAEEKFQTVEEGPVVDYKFGECISPDPDL